MLATLQPDNKTDQQVFAEHESALSFYSPVGGQEATHNLLEFTDLYINFIKINLENPLLF